MQAYAEGFTILEQKKEMALNLPQIAENMAATGSVVRSWLLDLIAGRDREESNVERAGGFCGGLRRRPLDGDGGDRPECIRAGHY